MNFPLHIDASFLKSWSDCREQARNSFIEERAPVVESIYYRMGTAVHLGVEEFWKGNTFERALYAAHGVCNTYPTKLLNPYFTNKWKELVDQLPDLLACYYDGVEYDPAKLQQWGTGGPMVEIEWSYPYSEDVILCGRIDRVMAGPELTDVKTASEIASYGQSWKDSYTRSSMLAVQFGLYDWYLGQIGLSPRRCYLEVLLKGYKSKPCRLEIIELPHVTTESYRQRFKQQLAFKLSEIVHYFKHYREQKPWPMSGGSACKTVYGECPMLEGCLNGWTPKVLEKFKAREEHLEVRK
jgi:hypothetical protein